MSRQQSTLGSGQRPEGKGSDGGEGGRGGRVRWGKGSAGKKNLKKGWTGAGWYSEFPGCKGGNGKKL